ncbi:hypothetical protein NXS19_011032 [Fusarium pseudograminearum]|nr:hypothetical protein NXS19_011032 [Fusarium pseudograminearum]
MTLHHDLSRMRQRCAGCLGELLLDHANAHHDRSRPQIRPRPPSPTMTIAADSGESRHTPQSVRTFKPDPLYIHSCFEYSDLQATHNFNFSQYNLCSAVSHYSCPFSHHRMRRHFVKRT